MLARSCEIFPSTKGVADALRRRGVSHLLITAVQKLCSPLLKVGSISLFARQLDDRPLPPSKDSLKLRLASHSDLSLLRAAYDHARSDELLRERFRRRDLCFIALDDTGRVAHCRWVTTQRGHLPEVNRDVVVGPGEAYFYDGYTRSDMRGQGIDGLMRSFIFNHLRTLGRKRVFSYVRGDNPDGLRAASRWQQKVGRLWYVRLGGFRPFVVGRHSLGQSTLARGAAADSDEEQKSLRATHWHHWFEGWLREPMAKRSTGCAALPQEYFTATAKYISSALGLDASSDSVLDVGCDSFMVSRLVGRHCLNFTGVDFIPKMLAQIPEDAAELGSGRRASLVAADGRSLPFRSGAFTKTYCSGVIHTLPGHQDGLRMIQELLRVCQPGGQVLVANVPDAGKRVQRYLEAWREADFAGRVKLVVSVSLPRSVKELLRRLLRLRQREQLTYLQYDLEGLKRQLEIEGHRCQIQHFPENFWSRDFRKTRSNLLINKQQALRLPAESQALALSVQAHKVSEAFR